MEVIVLDKAIHRERNRILIKFKYDDHLIDLVKSIEGARWSSSLNCWHIENTPNGLKTIFRTFRNHAKIDATRVFHKSAQREKTTRQPKQAIFKSKVTGKLATDISADINERLGSFRKWMVQKRYSEKTIQTYVSMLKVFFRFLDNKSPGLVTEDDILRFNSEYVIEGGFSLTFQNQVINAIKRFYLTAEHKNLLIENIERPRYSRTLPNILSKEEVEKLLSTPLNFKHKVMLSLIYACGLRRSELLNLKPWHVDYDRKLLIIKGAKGNKDRVAPLPQNIISMLKEYIQKYKPADWLIEGQKQGQKYSETSLQEVFRSNVEKSGINKEATLHWLRHSYATHLLEKGTDLRYIQEILGHKSSKTTEIYTHVSRKSIERIKSPFDDLSI